MLREKFVQNFHADNIDNVCILMGFKVEVNLVSAIHIILEKRDIIYEILYFTCTHKVCN